MARTVLEPGPQHPITVEPAPGRVTVQVAGTPVVYYVPLADVRSEVLKPSDHTTYCPYKGDASYYSIATAEGELTDVVWYYAEPYPAVADSAGHVAFYADKVDITAT